MRSAILTVLAAGLGSCLWVSPASADRCRYLEMRVMQLQAGGGSGAELRATRAMLNGCAGGQAVAAPASPQEPTIFRYRPEDPDADGSVARWKPFWAFEPVTREEQPRPERRQALAPTREPRARRDSSTFRTLCVRKCDGYYFPISFSTTAEHFDADVDACSRMCPAADVELFTLSTRDFGPEAMQSLEGTPYLDLENALRYRTVLDTSCTCGAPGETVGVQSAAAEPASALLPRPRGVQGEDPETLMNRVGRLTYPEPSSEMVATARSPEQDVRVVLPAWTSAQDQVLLTPVPN